MLSKRELNTLPPATIYVQLEHMPFFGIRTCTIHRFGWVDVAFFVILLFIPHSLAMWVNPTATGAKFEAGRNTLALGPEHGGNPRISFSHGSQAIEWNTMPYASGNLASGDVNHSTTWLPRPDAYVVTQVSPAFLRPEPAAIWASHYQGYMNRNSNSHATAPEGKSESALTIL